MSAHATALPDAPSPAVTALPCRIASLLPGLTDVLHDLHLSAHLVARSHECLSPSPSVTSPKLPSTASLPSLEIASGWNAILTTHPLISSPSSPDSLLAHRICSFYRVDLPALKDTKPTILLTHIAKARTPYEPDQAAVREMLAAYIPSLQTVISTDTQTLADVFQLHRDVARAVGMPDNAINPVAAARGRLESLRSFVDARVREGKAERRKVAIVQWTDPLFLAGDWVPRVAALAGAAGDGYTREGGPSVPVDVDALRGVDVVVFAVCAVGMEGCRRVVDQFVKRNGRKLQGWKGRFVVTDATTLFSRPAISTVVQSAEVIAEIVLGEACYGHKGVLWDEWKCL